MAALDRSANLLLAGLSRIPSYPHSFMTYLWTSLVQPVPCYGMELFAYPTSVLERFRACERKWWRKLLQVGGRSPNAAVQVLTGFSHCEAAWRSCRAALLLKLLNAPADSWHHLSVVAHHHLQTPWFLAAYADIAKVLPGVRLMPTMCGPFPFLSSSATWSDEGEWLSLHAYALPRNLQGLRIRPHNGGTCQGKAVKSHIKRLVSLLRSRLLQEHGSETFEQINEAGARQGSKLALLALRLQVPGPPLHIALDAVMLPHHRAAITSLLCGDWFLGVYAKNYFAKQLLPSSAKHLLRLQDVSISGDTVCLSCWHHRRSLHIEDEFHVMCCCPEYSRPRQELLASLPADGKLDTWQDIGQVLSGSCSPTLSAAARFCMRARQRRRQMKLLFERYRDKIECTGFVAKRAAWRMRGRPVCRHGVLFTRMPATGCKCLDPSSVSADWSSARYMPHLDEELKVITAVPFVLESFRRLGVLQAQARNWDWS